jgi:hypothetical protein
MYAIPCIRFLAFSQGADGFAGPRRPGDTWELRRAKLYTLPRPFRGFKIRVTFPVKKGYTKLLKASGGSMITVVTGFIRFRYTKLSTGKAVTENQSGPER